MTFKDIHGRDGQTWTVRNAASHSREVRAMFARIAGVYDLMNHLLSLNLDRRWRHRLAARVEDGVGPVLDLCAGTGDLSLACSRMGKGRLLVATDFCMEMLRRGRRKRGAEAFRLLAADAMHLPFADGSFDAVLVGFGVRNLADVRRGLQEMTRVLRPKGQLLVLEFFRDDPGGNGARRGASVPVRRALSALIPLVGRLFSRDAAAYAYLPGSIDEFVTVAEFADLLRAAGCQDIFIERMTFGVTHIVGGKAP